MSFKQRIEKSEIAINKFINWAKNNGLNYAFSGYEQLKSSDRFKNTLVKMNDKTANKIRYFPDIILLGKKAWLLEIKNSQSIEKSAYDTYVELYNLKWNVGIIFYMENKNIFLFSTIDELKFILPENNGLPIIDMYWIAPRMLDNYAIWKSKHPYASGTTFAYIDFNNTEWYTIKI